MYRFLAFVLFVLMPQGVLADAVTLLGDAPLMRARGALVQISASTDSAPRGGSLFIGKTGRSLFAPVSPRPKTGAPPDHTRVLPPRPALDGTPVQRLRQLIGHAESRRHGYDAVQHGARAKPGKPPTRMTIGEIYAWIEETPGQPHAIGKYQLIPPTLRRLVKITRLSKQHRFSPQVQDMLADVLLSEAGLGEVQSGRLQRETFMTNLAKIWAGLPTSSGKSYYHGHAGNKASMTWATYSTEMARIFPG